MKFLLRVNIEGSTVAEATQKESKLERSMTSREKIVVKTAERSFLKKKNKTVSEDEGIENNEEEGKEPLEKEHSGVCSIL